MLVERRTRGWRKPDGVAPFGRARRRCTRCQQIVRGLDETGRYQTSPGDTTRGREPHLTRTNGQLRIAADNSGHSPFRSSSPPSDTNQMTRANALLIVVSRANDIRLIERRGSNALRPERAWCRLSVRCAACVINSYHSRIGVLLLPSGPSVSSRRSPRVLSAMSVIEA